MLSGNCCGRHPLSITRLRARCWLVLCVSASSRQTAIRYCHCQQGPSVPHPLLLRAGDGGDTCRLFTSRLPAACLPCDALPCDPAGCREGCGVACPHAPGAQLAWHGRL